MTHPHAEAVIPIVREADAAAERYGDFTSSHEALGVLLEEFEELRAAIQSNSAPATAKEAMQVSAVALRLYRICMVEMMHPGAFYSRSNFRALDSTPLEA